MSGGLRRSRLACCLMACLTAAAVSALLPLGTFAQEIRAQDLRAAFARDTSLTLHDSNIRIESYPYRVRSFPPDSFTMEAILIRPLAEGSHPGVLMIPGYGRAAPDFVPLGVALAKQGYACLSISQPGFGRSGGKPDFVGPLTVGSLLVGYEKFIAEPFVDGSRTAIFGYSRGAMAASLMAPAIPGLRAAVFGGGIYDLETASAQLGDRGIKSNIVQEGGVDPAALRIRSSIHLADRIPCPVLILHGERDESAPLAQAQAMTERLRALGKPVELAVVPGAGHGLPADTVLRNLIDFLGRHLAPGSVEAGTEEPRGAQK